MIQGLTKYIQNGNHRNQINTQGNKQLNALFKSLLVDNNAISNVDMLNRMNQSLRKEEGIPESLIDYWIGIHRRSFSEISVWIESNLGCYVKRSENETESQTYLKEFNVKMPTLLRTGMFSPMFGE